MSKYNEFRNVDYIPVADSRVKPGIYLGKVVGYLDATYMGVLDVKLERSRQ